MSGDYSRMRFDPNRDFCGLLQQQGRVHLDSDANEFVHIVDRRQRAQTVDTIGRCTVPRETETGFRIDPGANNNLTIGAGRIYVDGMLAENHGSGTTRFDACLTELRGGAIDYTAQPYLRDAPALPASVGPHLVYVVVHQREITYLELPEIVESAVGLDTAAALQTAWQVRVLPDVGVGVSAATPVEQIPKWQALTRPSGARLTTRGAEVEQDDDPCILSRGGSGYRGLENQLYRVEIQRGGAQGTATFKWSRDNASVGTQLISAQATRLRVASVGRDAVLRFNVGDWIEVTDDVLELSGSPPEMRRITNVVSETRTIEIDSALPAGFPVDGQGNFEAARHTRIRKWDQDEPGLEAQGGAMLVPAAGEFVDLENGVQVAFDLEPEGEFKTGDYWTFAARIANAWVQPLAKAPPQGIHRHYGRLAMINQGAIEDCRVLWPPEAPKAKSDLALRVVDVLIGDQPFRNDSDFSAQQLAKGLKFKLVDEEGRDVQLDLRALRGKPACTVTLELPYPINDIDINMWNSAETLGFQPIDLAATVIAEAGVVMWNPNSATQRWIQVLLPDRLRRLQLDQRVIVRVKLRGNFIWTDEDPEKPRRYLDGDAFGMRRGDNLELRLPSGDGTRGGDFNAWFRMLPP